MPNPPTLNPQSVVQERHRSEGLRRRVWELEAAGAAAGRVAVAERERVSAEAFGLGVGDWREGQRSDLGV